MSRVYVASSWRNPNQEIAVDRLRSAGHEVYNYRRPNEQGPPDAPASGFDWADIDPDWQGWTVAELLDNLEHPIASTGYAADRAAMEWADVFVMVMPCGRSAHIEAGYAVGAGKPLAIWYCDASVEPELMHRLANFRTGDLDDIVDWVTGDPTWPPPTTIQYTINGQRPGGDIDSFVAGMAERYPGIQWKVRAAGGYQRLDTDTGEVFYVPLSWLVTAIYDNDWAIIHYLDPGPSEEVWQTLMGQYIDENPPPGEEQTDG